MPSLKRVKTVTSPPPAAAAAAAASLALASALASLSGSCRGDCEGEKGVQSPLGGNVIATSRDSEDVTSLSGHPVPIISPEASIRTNQIQVAVVDKSSSSVTTHGVQRTKQKAACDTQSKFRRSFEMEDRDCLDDFNRTERCKTGKDDTPGNAHPDLQNCVVGKKPARQKSRGWKTKSILEILDVKSGVKGEGLDRNIGSTRSRREISGIKTKQSRSLATTNPEGIGARTTNNAVRGERTPSSGADNRSRPSCLVSTTSSNETGSLLWSAKKVGELEKDRTPQCVGGKKKRPSWDSNYSSSDLDVPLGGSALTKRGVRGEDGRNPLHAGGRKKTLSPDYSSSCASTEDNDDGEEINLCQHCTRAIEKIRQGKRKRPSSSVSVTFGSALEAWGGDDNDDDNNVNVSHGYDLTSFSSANISASEALVEATKFTGPIETNAVKAPNSRSQLQIIINRLQARLDLTAEEVDSGVPLEQNNGNNERRKMSEPPLSDITSPVHRIGMEENLPGWRGGTEDIEFNPYDDDDDPINAMGDGNQTEDDSSSRDKTAALPAIESPSLASSTEQMRESCIKTIQGKKNHSYIDNDNGYDETTPSSHNKEMEVGANDLHDEATRLSSPARLDLTAEEVDSGVPLEQNNGNNERRKMSEPPLSDITSPVHRTGMEENLPGWRAGTEDIEFNPYDDDDDPINAMGDGNQREDDSSSRDKTAALPAIESPSLSPDNGTTAIHHNSPAGNGVSKVARKITTSVRLRNRKKTFQSYLSELSDYKAENNHVNVPQNYGDLGAWVKRIRKEGKTWENYSRSETFGNGSDKPCHLNAERVDQLNLLGFQWSLLKNWFESCDEYDDALLRGNVMNEHVATWMKRQIYDYSRDPSSFKKNKVKRMRSNGLLKLAKEQQQRSD